jgi:hypothetical protein
MICFFQDYFENSREFCSVKHFCSKGQWCVSVAGQRLDTRSFTDFMKRIEVFPATECACQ